MATAVPPSPQPPPTPTESPPQTLNQSSPATSDICTVSVSASSNTASATCSTSSSSHHSCCSDQNTSQPFHRHHRRRPRRCRQQQQVQQQGNQNDYVGRSSIEISSVELPCAEPNPAHQIDTLERKVRSVMRSNASASEKAAQIHQLFAEQRAAATASDNLVAPVKRGVFPGRGAEAGCKHYKRKCWIRAPCCDRYYPCRRCHDEAENHEINRHAISMIACVQCGDKDQPVSATCRTCGVRFARYFCAPCRLYNDDDSAGRTAYHCDKCGICRVGLGLGRDNHHCDQCNTCVPIERIHDHPCRERTLDSNCPICNVHLATSTESSYVLPCSHSIHVECLEQYVKAGNYTCPLCSKCLLDKDTMKKWYETLDERLKLDQMPPEFENRVSRVLCNDCETKTVAKFHFRFHKCKDCGGYNTRILEQWDVEPEESKESTREEETKTIAINEEESEKEEEVEGEEDEEKDAPNAVAD